MNIRECGNYVIFLVAVCATRGRLSAKRGQGSCILGGICCRRCEGVVAMADKADPRMPSAVRHYVAPIVNPNDLPPDYSSLAAIIFGIFGVMMRVSTVDCCSSS